MCHESAMASIQFGLEIGKGMQEQGKARQLGVDGELGSNRPRSAAPIVRTFTSEAQENPHSQKTETTVEGNHDGDNPSFGNWALEVQ